MGQPGAGRSGGTNPPGKEKLVDTARNGMEAGLL